MKICKSEQDIKTFYNNMDIKVKVLEALKERELTPCGIHQYCLESYGRNLTEPLLSPQLKKLEGISFIEKEENGEHYKLLKRGRNALEEHLRFGRKNFREGLKDFIRWHIIENGGGTTDEIIDNYINFFGLHKKSRRKSEKKHEITDWIKSMSNSPEFEFNQGKLDFRKLDTK
ncbi:MAG: hypothetical protein GTN36_05130 [Candidatus Aenigmarchaeota archaeon]|nr:hypothetical protein [Candidatus Aenigmarchaeota archaeon]